MSAVILAQSIYDRREVLRLNGDLHREVGRLVSLRLFSVGEISEISGLSEYLVRKTTPPEDLLRAKSGVKPGHLEFLLRMIGNPSFAKRHTPRLIKDGATLAALSRVTGLPESSLRRWTREE